MSTSNNDHTAVEELQIKVAGGSLCAKRWIPDNSLTDIPLILLHDSLGCVALWRKFPEQLAGYLSRPVIAYDRLGFGQSGKRDALPSTRFIEEEATDYFPAVKNHFGIDKYVLIGHSVGGGMALNIAAHDSDCMAVITISAQAFVEELTIKGIEAAQAMFRQPDQFDRLLKWHGEKADWVLRAWTDLWLAPEFRHWSLSPVLDSVRCPVLAIHGERDEFGSNAFPEYISGRVGGIGEMLIIKDCSHMPHKEKTGQVMAAIADFLIKFQ